MGIDGEFNRIYDGTRCEKYKRKVGWESPGNVGLAALPPPGGYVQHHNGAGLFKTTLVPRSALKSPSLWALASYHM